MSRLEMLIVAAVFVASSCATPHAAEPVVDDRPMLLATMIPGPALEYGRAAPAVGPGFIDSFTVACTTTATQIIPPSGLVMASYTCQNVSTTIVGVGDASIADPDIGTRNSPVYCATSCPSQEFGGNVRYEYCRADTGTVTIYCRGLVTQAP